jgi:hypothetical protein
MHLHRKADPGVHCTNTDQPNLSRLAPPDKNWISDFQRTNKDSRDGKEVFPPYGYFGINDVERRADESAPYTRIIPPAGRPQLALRGIRVGISKSRAREAFLRDLKLERHMPTIMSFMREMRTTIGLTMARRKGTACLPSARSLSSRRPVLSRR